MKKMFSVITALFLTLSIPLAIYCETAEINSETFTIRNGVKFGMSAQEVILLEGADPDSEHWSVISDNDHSIIYDAVSVSGQEASLSYDFSDDKLYFIFYRTTKLYYGFSLHYQVYEDVKAALVTKYGHPTENREDWRKNMQYLYENYEQYKAIANGDLTRSSEWRFDDFSITITTSPLKPHESTWIIYSCYRFKVVDDNIPAPTLNIDGL